MSQRLPTIKDVAGLAGVSTATVSKVLRGNSSAYAPPTVQRVRDAATALKYSPNHVARSLVRRRTHMLGVVIQGRGQVLTRNADVAELLDGVLDYAVNHGYQTAIITLPHDEPFSIVSYIQNGFVEGVALLTPDVSCPLLAWARESHFPSVVVGTTLPPEARLACVDVDNTALMHQAVRWLVGRGHERIGFLNGPRTKASSCLREEAYGRALQDLGVVPSAGWRFQGSYSAESGYEGAVQLLSVRPRLTALIGGNDQMALGALQACRDQGVRVPEDISLLGIDDIEAARLADPPLSTLHQPLHDIGSKAAEVLIRQIETGKRETQTTLFPVTLVERQSVAPMGETPEQERVPVQKQY